MGDAAIPMHRRRLDEDRAGAAQREAREMREVPVIGHAVDRRILAERRDDDAVAQGDAAQRHRRQKQRLSHAYSFRFPGFAARWLAWRRTRRESPSPRAASLSRAANYALALAVVGRALRRRALAALVKGGVMGAFDLWVAASTVYAAIAGALPEAQVMGVVGALALAANLTVAALLFRYRRSDSQALSVWLCTRNDALINLAVIATSAGVRLTGGLWPDIAVAAVVAALALSGAWRITRQARQEMRALTEW